MNNPRKAAAKALKKIDEEKSYSNLTVNAIFKECELSSVDKSFATALVYGVLDRKITIDYVLSKYIKTPLKKVAPFTLQVLRTALYQVMFMDKIPPSAAVDEAVKLVKKSNENRNSGFVNAVLRNILRSDIQLPSEDTVDELSIRYSCPIDIINSFISDYGLDNAKSILEESLKPSKLTVKVNTEKISVKDFKDLFEQGVEETKIYNGLILNNGLDISSNKFFNDGLFYVQDLASQTAVIILNPEKSSRVLDICAAPGGKSFSMALAMENKGEIISCDLYPNRVDLIKASAKRLGLSIIKPMINDALVFNNELGLFDAVLCDVPCSGLGVIGRKPEIKFKNFSEFDDLCDIQLNILKNASKYLKHGGKLLYSTCTLRKRENEDIINLFLNECSEFKCVYTHTFMPHIDGTDGFYCALLTKR